MKASVACEFSEGVPSAPPWRNRFRFRLPTIFWMMTAIAAFMGYWVSGGHRQQIAVAELRKIGCDSNLFYDNDVPAGRNSKKPFGASFTRKLLGRDFVDQVWSVGLYFNQQATDATVAKPLGELSDIRSLQLDGTRVGDGTMSSIRSMTELEHLSLVGTNVTEAGIAYLCSLSKLTAVDARGTAVTEEGARLLRETLPNCVVVTGPNPLSPAATAQINRIPIPANRAQ